MAQENPHTKLAINEALLNSYSKYAANNTSQCPLVYLDQVAIRFVQQSSLKGQWDKILLPDHLKNYFCSPYIELSPSGAINLSLKWKLALTNGSHLHRAHKGIPYPFRRGSASRHLNELLPAEVEEILKDCDGNQPWEYQVEILIWVLQEVITFTKATFGSNTVVKYLKLQTVEFYVQFPLPSNYKAFFQRGLRTISKLLHAPIKIVNPNSSWLEAEFKLPNRINRKTLCQNLLLKFYKKNRTFRTEERYENLKLEMVSEPQALLKQFQHLYRLTLETLQPIHDEILANTPVTQIDPYDVWAVLDAFKFRGKIHQRDDFKKFVELISVYGVYTPAPLKELKLSRHVLKSLLDPQSGILVVSTTSRSHQKTYLLRPDWNRVLLPTHTNTNHGGESKGNNNENP